jgi:hypothetical protein
MTSLGGARHKSGADPWSAAWSAADPLVRSRPPGPQPTPWSAADPWSATDHQVRNRPPGRLPPCLVAAKMYPPTPCFTPLT